MEKVLLTFNDRTFNDAMKPFHLHISELSDILEAYKGLRLAELDSEDFKSLIYNPTELVFNKMTNDTIFELNGYPVCKSKAVGLITMPEGFSQLEALISAFKQRINWDYYLNSSSIIEGEICVNPTIEEKERERNTVYARTEKQLKAYEFAKFVLDKSEELFGEGKITDLGHFISSVLPAIPVTSVNKRVNINFKVIQNIEMGLPNGSEYYPA